MKEEFKILEEALLNSIPSLQTVFLDGWVLRLNQKYTYRANCVCPLIYTEGNHAVEKVRMCEELFGRNKLPSVFKVTPVLQDGLSEQLLSLDYRNIKTVNVMRYILKGSATDIRPEIECSEIPDDNWLTASAKLMGVTSAHLVSVHCQGLKNIAVKSIFVKAVCDGKIIGCGYGTVERGYVGIYNLHVDNEYRHRGIGTSICHAIINYGREHDAKFAYLIVHSKNQNSILLYSHMGFSKLYEYSFYQKSDSPYQIADV